jgi:ectoine hydroxylase-related dioxygenase (phytanoyl-CoA dioxygenase family)
MFYYYGIEPTNNHSCVAGDLVIIHGSVLHKSPRNTSNATRYAYTFHMIESPPVRLIFF